MSYLIILFEGIYSKITTVLEFSCHYFSESKWVADFLRWVINRDARWMKSFASQHVCWIPEFPLLLRSLSILLCFCLLQLLTPNHSCRSHYRLLFTALPLAWCCHQSPAQIIILFCPDWFQSLVEGDVHFFLQKGILPAFLLAPGFRPFSRCCLISRCLDRSCRTYNRLFTSRKVNCSLSIFTKNKFV